MPNGNPNASKKNSVISRGNLLDSFSWRSCVDWLQSFQTGRTSGVKQEKDKIWHLHPPPPTIFFFLQTDNERQGEAKVSSGNWRELLDILGLNLSKVDGRWCTWVGWAWGGWRGWSGVGGGGCGRLAAPACQKNVIVKPALVKMETVTLVFGMGGSSHTPP